MTTSRKVGINLDLNTSNGVPRAKPKQPEPKVVIPSKPVQVAVTPRPFVRKTVASTPVQQNVVPKTKPQEQGEKKRVIRDQFGRKKWV